MPNVKCGARHQAMGVNACVSHCHCAPQVYAYYLRPVELGMAKAGMRPARLMHWLEGQVGQLWCA